jgi:hypothetical protein
MRYYYFAAGLPWLTFGAEAPMTFDAFLDRAGDFLSARDLRALRALSDPLFPPDGHPFVRAWRAVETRVRNAAARARAARRRLDAAPHLREESGTVDMALERAVNEALAQPDPLQREMALDRVRWGKLEDLGGFEPFSSEAVLAYGAKLRLVERWDAMNQEEGAGKMESLVKREAAPSGVNAMRQ